MLRYTFNLLLLVACIVTSSAQTGRKKGLRVGADLSRIAYSLLDTDHQQFQYSLDYEILPKYYATVEYGEARYHKIKDTTYNYYSSGAYGRIGIDINTMQKKLRVDQYEMTFIGFRYGFAKYHYEAPSITVYDAYWNGSVNDVMPRRTAQTHWLEVVGGIRGEMFKGFFIGWSFSARLRLPPYNNDENGIIDPLYIPGFGKGSKKLNLGFNYSVYYTIPFYTVKEKHKPAVQE